MKSTELKKTLEQFDKKELIQLIIESAKLNKDNMEWLEIELQKPDELPELLKYYKMKISKALYSNDFIMTFFGIGMMNLELQEKRNEI